MSSKARWNIPTVDLLVEATFLAMVVVYYAGITGDMFTGWGWVRAARVSDDTVLLFFY